MNDPVEINCNRSFAWDFPSPKFRQTLSCYASERIYTSHPWQGLAFVRLKPVCTLMLVYICWKRICPSNQEHRR
jgi:hypothetical protein